MQAAYLRTVSSGRHHTDPAASRVNKRSLIKLCYETVGDKVDINELGSSFTNCIHITVRYFIFIEAISFPEPEVG
jgi:hypothetical protein